MTLESLLTLIKNKEVGADGLWTRSKSAEDRAFYMGMTIAYKIISDEIKKDLMPKDDANVPKIPLTENK